MWQTLVDLICFSFLIQSGEGIELEEISDLPEVKSQEDAVLPPSHLPTVGKFRRMAIILDYFSFHILIHLTLIGLDSYIAYWLILSTFSNESTHFTAPTGRTVNDVVFLRMHNVKNDPRIRQTQLWDQTICQTKTGEIAKSQQKINCLSM